ncbi:MAG: HNH endonuclease [Clostridium saudiense]|uniref:HNH endonuclease n=1 Tax=Clostridium saudiense TaxID=1414720 RepID=UPI00399685C6
MAHKNKWLDEIIEAIEELGGHAFYKDIYDKIIERDNMDLIQNKSWRASVRGTIERYSSDSDVYNGKLDIFYSVEGKGKGHWGLRNFTPTIKNIDITDDDAGFPEGRKMLKQHIVRERDPRVIKKAKDIFKEKNDRIYCEVCGFDYESVYGDIGIDYIEGHHIKPVSELGENEVTKIEDIILVCANCHRMIHRKRPWISKERLKDLINRDNILSKDIEVEVDGKYTYKITK